MGDWPQQAGPMGLQASVITPLHPWALGNTSAASGTAVFASAAWPTTNLGLFVPFRLPVPVIAYQLVTGCGTTAGGNFDIGIYNRNDIGGSVESLIVSSGSTARVASSEVVVNIADTFLGPGCYYLALSVDGTDNMILQTLAVAGLAAILGVREAASAFPLGATESVTTTAGTVVPDVQIRLRSF